MRHLRPSFVTLFSSLAAALDLRLLNKRGDCDVGGDGLRNTLTIINSTPYPFYRSRLESCQIGQWTFENTPPVIDPGKTATFEYLITRGGDAAADISYVLKIDDVLTEKHFNIHVQGREGLVGHIISAEVLGGLSTVGHGSDQGVFQFGDIKDALPQLGYPDVFVLSGNETHGYSTVEPPVTWMNDMGPLLKQLSLKELVIPASHDSGESQTVDGIAIDFNARTQDVAVYDQLVRGIRMLDFRPHLGPNDDDFRLGHFSGILGAFGQSLADAMGDINRFQNDFPGELIIVDLGGGYTRLKGPTSTPFSEQQFNNLLDTLTRGIPGLATEYELTVDPSTTSGMTAEPIDTFFQKNRSPIFLRVPSDTTVWLGRIPQRNDHKTTGVVSSDFLPIVSRWSDMDNAEAMRDDQQALLESKYDPNKPFMTCMILTLKDAANLDPLGSSIRALAFQAKRMLYENVFDWSSKDRYPNVLQFDYVLDKQVTALAIAMNYQFAFARHWPQ